ncbi:phage repressor protein [Paenibacillus amylolyticus]|uniref:BRO-N domain-containing protein n=1 Tax=Paenibacillus amylolyticus TaxID=1451 RepID=UPI00096EDE30|nr:BRO family protein [Paenibacillus amylolyticus]OMF04011.1 phage repressor protein [Paenibacillus amylolyticus]
MNIRTEKWLDKEIRFVEKEAGDWWAVAADVTKALGIRNTAQAINGNPRSKSKGLLDSQKGVCKLDTPGGLQDILIVNEPGIYRLIFRSNKRDAEAFQDWVFDIIKALRQSTGLEGFQVFRMLDKDHQRSAMANLCKTIKNPVQVDFIKANTIANKAVSTKYGRSKMIKKNHMTPEMLVDRQPILDETVELMGLVSKFDLPIKVSETIYGRYAT